MRYLPLLILGLLLSFLFPTAVKADECTGKNAGDPCGAFIRRIDENTCMPCHGTCVNSGGVLACSVTGGNVGCSPSYACSSASPTPTGAASPTPTLEPPPTAGGNIVVGVQIPKETTINRLIPSQYSFQWVKFQFSLGSTQPLEQWVNYARSASAGGGRTYQVLISVAKNTAGIETLKNPDTYPPEQAPEYFTHQYCPWDEELETYRIEYDCGVDRLGNPQTCSDERRAKPKADNGYIKFRDEMQALAPRLGNVSAVEIWNEPNLEDEWTAQGLGPVSPENYVNFMNCGIKGLRRGGYTGKVISAGLAPNAYATATGQTNMHDYTFFDRFMAANGLENIDAIGWHSNVTSNISPTSPDENGFQRVSYALGKGKPVWLTEYGWDRSTFRIRDEYQARQLQAQYVAQAYEVANRLGGIGGMFIWNFGWTVDVREQTAFIPWDIEGTIPQGLLCQPNPRRTTRPDKGDTRYVQEKTLADDVKVSSVAGIAQLPRILIDETTQKVKDAAGTQVEVTKSFFSELLNWLSLIRNFFCSTLGSILNLGDYCTPNLSIGKPEEGTMPPGKNTQQFATQTKILGEVGAPDGMDLIPEAKDCNIGNVTGNDTDIGEKKLNELSEYMGTSTGFYGNNLPNFKLLNPEDWFRILGDRMKLENLNVGNKLFEQDRRSSDIYYRKQVFCKGLYPNEICPFEPTPTPAI